MLAVCSGASMGYRYEIFNRPFHHELAYPKNFIPDSRGGEGKIIGHNKGARTSPHPKSLVSRFSQDPRFTTVGVIIRGDGPAKVGNCTHLHSGLISFLRFNWEGSSENCLFHGNLIEYLVS
jgi:hypothetical protein